MHSRELQELLDAELEIAETLMETLKLEYQALQQTNPDILEAIVASKHEQLKQMTDRGAARRDYLTNHGCGNDADSIEHFMKEHESSALEKWLQLKQLAHQLETQNNTNGGMIQLSQQRTQLALDILTQRNADHKTYGKKGYTEQDAPAHTSIKV